MNSDPGLYIGGGGGERERLIRRTSWLISNTYLILLAVLVYTYIMSSKP